MVVGERPILFLLACSRPRLRVDEIGTAGSRRLGLRMARDAVLMFLGYVLLVAPPDFVSNSLGNLGLASELSTRSAPPPSPFFVDSRWVDDYFSGAIYDAFEEAANHQDAVFLFYAPWDVDSMRAREALDAAANIFEDHSHVYFAAVNCWTAVGDCFKEFGAGKARAQGRPKDEQQLPILVFYPRDRKGIQYFGPIHSSAIAQFIHNAQNPLAVITSREELLELRAGSASTGALVGYFPDLYRYANASTDTARLNLGYRRFLHASYELLESDPFRREIGPLAVVTSPKLAFQLQLSSSQPVRYFHWNATSPTSSVAYPNKTITTSASLVRWVYNYKPKGRLTSWIGAINRKSLFLAERLSAGSGKSLLLFTRRRLDVFNDGEAGALRETALKYHSCQGQQDGNEARKQWTSEELAAGVSLQSRSSDLELDSVIWRCLRDPWFERQYCRTGGGGEGGEPNCVCQATYVDNRTVTSAFGSESDAVVHSTPRTIPPSSSYYLKSSSKNRSGPISDVNVHNRLVLDRRLQCALAAADPRSCLLVKNPSKYMSTGGHDYSDVMYGLGCSGNRTLNFYLADISTQSALARQIGIDESSISAEYGTAVIVDLEAEAVYQLDAGTPPSSRSLEEFVVQFHAGPSELKRLKLSNGPRLANSVDAPAKEETDDDPLHPLAIREVTSADFDSLVLNATGNVLLLYASRFCGACASFAHSVHALQRLLAPAFTDSEDPRSSLEFFTVDAGANNLPWQFSALTVPSVLFFPAGGPSAKADTRAFPASKAMNVTNLLNFVIANIPVDARLKLSLSLCDDDCLMRSRVELAKKLEDFNPQDAGLPGLQALDRELLSAQESRYPLGATRGSAEQAQDNVQSISTENKDDWKHKSLHHNEL